MTPLTPTHLEKQERKSEKQEWAREEPEGEKQERERYEERGKGPGAGGDAKAGADLESLHCRALHSPPCSSRFQVVPGGSGGSRRFQEVHLLLP